MWADEKRRLWRIGGKILRLEPELLDELTICKRDVGFSIRLRRDNGKIEHFLGWRVLHRNPYNTGTRPYKGGFMLSPSAGLNLLRTKAALMTLKCALVGPDENERIPFGGSKGGVRCNPENLSQSEKRQIMEKVAEELKNDINPTRDSLGPDVGVGPEEIRAFMTRYAALNQDKGIQCGAAATGKPLENAGGGCPGRLTATGLGMHFILQEILKHHPELKNIPSEPAVIIQGFGNVGKSFAELARDFSVKVIGVSDIHGGIYNPNGISITDLVSYTNENSQRTVLGFPDAKDIAGNKLLLMPCDVLAPAATENVITRQNAGELNTKILHEGANAPTVAGADPILQKRGIIVVPDILANAGGVTVSYFEWCQDTQGKFWEEKDTKKELMRYMIGGAKRTLDAAQRFKTDLRTAAYIASLSYLAPALRKKQGWDKSKKSLI